MKVVKVQHIPLQLEMVTKSIEMNLMLDQPKQMGSGAAQKTGTYLFILF